ncbi:hypothetical protein C8F04DRAFT_1387692 [Mycena alexandri]|uniref:Uncharacterized protein n=1 Tax=Mycena alexandri TaxID=1745969 RepID=A0AAD6TJI0_9AGAR|nr:hypothetical protein C8F04DRAFT_1387692 [Mycena alexandri]
MSQEAVTTLLRKQAQELTLNARMHGLIDAFMAEFAKVDKSDPEDEGLHKTFDEAEQLQGEIMMRHHRLIDRHRRQIAALECSMPTE